MIKEIISLYKKSILITIRYTFVTIVAFFINVFINRLDMTTINYFYAVMVIMFFIEQCEIAMADVASIFTLKAHGKNSKASHLKTFLVFLLAFMVVIYGFVFLFKDFLFNIILEIEVIDDYKFLYMMLASYAVSIPTLYLQDYLKFNNRYREYLHTTILFNFCLTAFFFVFILLDRTINNYAYANIIASIVTGFYTFSFIKRQKQEGFGITYLVKRKIINFKESVKASAEILTQYTFYFLGSFIKSLIMIRISVKLFATNEFLTVVFWLCEGMFESLITTININLTKLISENKEKAFTYAKRSFKIIIVNQLIFIIFYLLTRNFIISFVNPEIYDVAKKVDLFLLAFVSISIVDWALSYNILIRGNKIGLQTFLEMFVFIGYVVCFALVQLHIVENIYLILILINLLICFRFIINLIYFYTKKWL